MGIAAHHVSHPLPSPGRSVPSISHPQIHTQAIDWDHASFPTLLHFLRLCFPLCSQEDQHALLASVLAALTALCQSLAVDSLTRCRLADPLLRGLAKAVSLVHLVMDDFAQRSDVLLAVPKLARTLLLHLHHCLLTHDTVAAMAASNILRVFPPLDCLYYSLFLLRWTSRCCDAALETAVAVQLVKPVTLSSIQTALCSSCVHRSLLTPFLGDAAFTLSLDRVANDALLRPFFAQFAQDQLTKTFEVQTELGLVELELEGHRVACCPAQAILLLFFAHTQRISLNELVCRSPFSAATTKRIVASLSCCVSKDGYVELPPLMRDIELPSLLVLPLNETGQEKEEERLLCEREVYQSWVMKLVKQKKRVSFEAVLKYVERNVAGGNREEMKKAVEDLIEREYVERDAGNDAMLVYARCMCLFHSSMQRHAF